jgi:hypothetical protein
MLSGGRVARWHLLASAARSARDRVVGREPISKVDRFESGWVSPNRIVDESEIKSDLLGTADLESLAHFKRAHEACRVDKRVGGAGVKPREAQAHALDVERSSR